MFPPSRKLIDPNTSSLARAYASILFDVNNRCDIECPEDLSLIIDGLGKYIDYMNTIEDNYHVNRSKLATVFPLACTNAFEVVVGEERGSNEKFKEVRGEFCYLERQLKKLSKDSVSFYKKNHEDVSVFLQKMNSSFYN
ncbi:hypothetical protein KAS08_00740 [Candidatus Pacearchaeota archaeon]|nr:hypothetical protein [Candidatus Pacearchaeota archaeon]